MTAVDDAFISLFYGEGAILGLLLFMLICVGLVRKWKPTGALVFPLIMLLEVEYYTRWDNGNYFWHMFSLIIFGLFIAIYTIAGKEGR